MGFEAPLALLGLLAVGVPIAAHLMRRRDLRTFELPTIALLHRAQARSRKRLRVVDLLLLACRILVVALLAGALSGPFFTYSVAFGDGRPSALAVVVDDSMSMSRTEGGRTLLAAALARARDALSSLPPGSEAAVVLAGSPVRVLVPRTDDPDEAAGALESLPATSARGTDLPTAVARAVRELSGARLPVRRILVLSDFARHGRLDRVSWPEGDVEVVLERIGPERADENRTVAGAVAVPDPTTPGQASVRIEVRSFGRPGGTVSLRLVRGGREVARGSAELVEGVGRTMLHAPLPEDDPTATIEVVGDDALQMDDARGVLLRRPTAVRVLLVDGDPHPSRHEDEVGFLAQALEHAPQDDGVIAWRTVDPDTLGAHTLADVDVVVLANTPAPPAVVARRLVELVAHGGGLLVAPGDRFDATAYPSRLGDVLPARPRAAASQETRLGLVAADGTLLAIDDDGLGQVRTERRLLLESPGPAASIALAFDDGAPALVVGRSGEGRTAILATTVDDDWSDLPYRPGYLPLVVRLVRWLSPPGRTPDRAFATGEPIMLSPPPGAARLRVITPGGTENDLDVSAPEVAYRDTAERGAYRVQVAEASGQLRDDPRTAFVAAPPLTESDLSVAALPELGVDRTGREGGVARRPLAPWLFLFAAVFLLVEAVLRYRF